MKKASILYCFCWVGCILPLFSQNLPDTSRYRQADQWALSQLKESNLILLSEKIMAAFPDDLSRARSAFSWITRQVQFDYRFVNSGKEIIKPECAPGDDCAGKMIQWEHQWLRQIVKTKKTTAEGYARLFKKICELMFIPCEVIHGYTKTKPYQIGNNLGANHYWNAIYLDTAWFYSDPAWAAGYCPENDEGLLLPFVREFREYYFIQTQASFNRNHYPKKGFQVEKMLISKEQFLIKPHYFSIPVLENLTEIEPLSGLIKCQKGDSLIFRFRYAKPIQKIQVNSNIFRNPPLMREEMVNRKKKMMVPDEWAAKKQVYIPFNRNGNEYELGFRVKQESLYYLELVFDYEPIIRYRVRVDSEKKNLP